MARRLVMSYGMSEELGPISLGDHHEMVFLGREIAEQKNYSEDVAKKIDDEVNKIMRKGLQTATEMLTKYRDYLNTIANRLIKDETLEQEQFNEIVKDIIPKDKKTITEFDALPTTEAVA
jgi:cell division protease FtsH